MTYNEAKALCRNPGAFTPFETWMVINAATGEPLESAKSESRAKKVAQWVNDHEERCGRTPVYVAEKLKQRK